MNESNWTKYRKWKHTLSVPLVAIAYWLLTGRDELTLGWYTGLAFALVIGAAYIIEELLWIARSGGRPCINCEHPIPMRSFRVHSECQKCGHPID